MRSKFEFVCENAVSGSDCVTLNLNGRPLQGISKVTVIGDAYGIGLPNVILELEPQVVINFGAADVTVHIPEGSILPDGLREALEKTAMEFLCMEKTDDTN